MNGKKVKAKGLTMKQTSSFLVKAVLASTLFCLNITTAQAVLVPIPANIDSNSGALPDGGNGYNFAGAGSNFVITNGYAVGQTGGIAIDNNNGVANTPFEVLLNFAGNANVQGNIGTTNPLPLILLNTAGITANVFDFDGTLLQAGEVNVAGPGGTFIVINSVGATPRVLNTNFTTNNANIDQIIIAGQAATNTFNGTIGSEALPFGVISILSPASGDVTFAQDIYANTFLFAEDGDVNFYAHPHLNHIATLAGDNSGTVNFFGQNTLVDFPIGALNSDIKQVNFGTLGPANIDALTANIFALDVDVLPNTTLIVAGSPIISVVGGAFEINPNASLILPNSNNLTVVGDLIFDNGASYKVDMNGNLLTTGIINVSGGTITSATNKITILNPGFSPGVNTVIPLINSAGGISALPTVSNPNSLLTTFSTSLNPGSTILNLIVSSKPSTLYANQGNTQGIASVIDGLALGAPTATPLDDIIEQMSLFTDAKSLNDALATLAPIVDGAILYESFNTQDRVFGIVGDRMDRMNFWRIHTASPNAKGISSGDLKKSDQGLWTKFFKQHGSQSYRHGIAGYKDDTWGVVLGGDTMLTPLTLIGASFAWAALDINNDVSASKTYATSYQGTMYASLDFDCPLYINAEVGLAYNNYTVNRNVIFNELSLYPRGHFHGYQTGAKAETGYVFGTYQWHVIPLASVFYSNLSLRGYQETNAGPAGQFVNGEDFDTLLTGVGVKFVDDFAINDYMLLQSEIHTMGFYDFIQDDMHITSQFVGAGPSFITNGFTPARASMNLGASLTLFTHYNFTLSGDYDYHFKEDYHSHSGFFRIRYEFS